MRTFNFHKTWADAGPLKGKTLVNTVNFKRNL